MSTQNSKTEQEIISIVTIHRKYNLEEEIIEFLSKKGFNVELDSHKEDVESPRLVILVKEQDGA